MTLNRFVLYTELSNFSIYFNGNFFFLEKIVGATNVDRSSAAFSLF